MSASNNPAEALDPIVVELRKLREGLGLTLDKLQASPNVLATLSTTDPKVAFDALAEKLTRMPDTEQLRALVVDLGFDLDELLERPATPREKALLGERRSGYSQVIGRDVKTLARWSDRAILELRELLTADLFEGTLLITAGVQNRRLAGIEVMRYELADSEFKSGTTQSLTNPVPVDETSLPVLLYQIPNGSHWKIHSIRFVVLFTDEQPSSAWALACNTPQDVSFGNERFPLDIEDGLTRCRIDNPLSDQIYGVWWEW